MSPDEMADRQYTTYTFTIVPEMYKNLVNEVLFVLTLERSSFHRQNVLVPIHGTV